MGFLISPSLSPFVFGFLVARARSVSPFLDAFFLTLVHMLVGDGHLESVPCTAHWFFSLSYSSGVRRELANSHNGSRFHLSRMYDRGVKYLPPRQADCLRYRIKTLVGVTGFKLTKYRTSWVEAISVPFKLFWRPHMLGILIFEVPHYLQLRYHSL